MPRVLAICAAASIVVGCSSTPSGGSGTGPDPIASTPLTQPVTIAFGSLNQDGSLISTYTESGLSLSATPTWTVFANYGNPQPSIVFFAEAGATVTGQLRITGHTFLFKSVDLYSSTTPIPYTITGSRNGTSAFQSSDTLPPFTGGLLPNTFGNFRTVQGTGPNVVVDSLTISLTNPAAPCCRNPMGLDNIVLLPPQ